MALRNLSTLARTTSGIFLFSSFVIRKVYPVSVFTAPFENFVYNTGANLHGSSLSVASLLRSSLLRGWPCTCLTCLDTLDIREDRKLPLCPTRQCNVTAIVPVANDRC